MNKEFHVVRLADGTFRYWIEEHGMRVATGEAPTISRLRAVLESHKVAPEDVLFSTEDNGPFPLQPTRPVWAFWNRLFALVLPDAGRRINWSDREFLAVVEIFMWALVGATFAYSL